MDYLHGTGRDGWDHLLTVTDIKNGIPLVSAHTNERDNFPLYTDPLFKEDDKHPESRTPNAWDHTFPDGERGSNDWKLYRFDHVRFNAIHGT